MGPSEAFKSLQGRARAAYYDSLPASAEELRERIGGAQAVISIRASVKYPEALLADCPDLKILSIFGTGTDHVDLDAARRLGLTVTNTPGVAAAAMAEHALTLMLAAARNIPSIDARTKAGEWPRGAVTQLHGKTLGVIGLGAIGRQMARIARGIGMRVIAWTFHPDPQWARDAGVELVELDELYRQSGVVSLHLRLSEKTRGFIGRREIGMMKPGAIFVNTARGAIVDEAALIAALSDGRLAAAGLDVFEQEPLPAGHPLTRLPNVALTPHSGGVTPEALEVGLKLAVENVFAFFEGKPRNVVR